MHGGDPDNGFGPLPEKATRVQQLEDASQEIKVEEQDDLSPTDGSEASNAMCRQDQHDENGQAAGDDNGCTHGLEPCSSEDL